MESTHTDRLTIRTLLPRLDDGSISSLARLALDDKVGNVSHSRDGAVRFRVNGAEVVHAIELDRAGRPLMDELLQGDLVEGIGSINGGGGGSAFDGSAGRSRERAARKIGAKGRF